MAPKPFRHLLPHLRAIHYHNFHALLSQPLAELSGSLGDLGTLLPLMIALTLTGSISLPSTLLFTGAANIYSGLAFGIPIPVQPMKAVAAVAIARHFSREETAAAGIVVAALVGAMSVTGVVRWASAVTPIPVVKGIQVGAGLSLCLSAGSSLLSPLSWTGPWWGDNLIWALSAAILLLATLPYPRAPYALAIFVLGLILAAFNSPATSSPDPATNIPILHPSVRTFWHATTTAALGQLPLTLLNSVIAVSALAVDLFPSPPYPTPPSVTSLGISVSLMNLIGCWFGAMPTCHGSGGLAAQYRFGARSGSSIVALGALKVVLGLVTLWKASGIVRILRGFPAGLLGVLVLAAGVELAKVGESLNSDARDLRVMHRDRLADGGDGEEMWDGKRVRPVDERERGERWMVMLVTVAALLAFRNDGVGFLAGLAWHWGLCATRGVERWREGRNRREDVPEEERGLLR